MKKILFVTRDLSYIGGTEEFIKNILISLSQNKATELFLLEIEGHARFENKTIYKKIEANGVHLISFDQNNKDIASIGKIQNIIQVIKKYKIDIVHSFLFNSDFLCCTAKLGPKKMWQKLNKIESFDNFIKIVPSVKKFETSKIQPVNFYWVSSKTIDVSIALEKDTPEWVERKRIIDNEIEPIVSKNCNVVLPVFKKGVKKWNKFSKHVELLPCVSINSTDMQDLNKKSLTRNLLRESFGLDSDTKAFVSVARLVPEKGVNNIIDLFKEEKKTSKNTLFIAGSGILEKELRFRARGANNIHFLGHLNRNQIFDLLIAGDVFVLLSYSEGFPLAIQEAMAASLPILTTHTGGVSDLVSKSNGLICKVGDYESMKVGFKWFKNQKKSVLQRMGKHSKSKIVNSFMLEGVTNRLTEIYFHYS